MPVRQSSRRPRRTTPTVVVPQFSPAYRTRSSATRQTVVAASTATAANLTTPQSRAPPPATRRRIVRPSVPVLHPLQPPSNWPNASRLALEEDADDFDEQSFFAHGDDTLPDLPSEHTLFSPNVMNGESFRLSTIRARRVLSKPDNLAPKIPLHKDELARLTDVSRMACWTLSSAKVACGVDNLLDDRLDTFWQSDGSTPHYINAQFSVRTAVKFVCVYCDYKQDESYTPQKLSIRSGNYLLDLEEIVQFEMREPKGWEIIPMPNEPWGAPHRCFFLQICILSNYQQGRDSHLRQIKILSPSSTLSAVASNNSPTMQPISSRSNNSRTLPTLLQPRPLR